MNISSVRCNIRPASTRRTFSMRRFTFLPEWQADKAAEDAWKDDGLVQADAWK